jgi:hypothetical protein
MNHQFLIPTHPHFQEFDVVSAHNNRHIRKFPKPRKLAAIAERLGGRQSAPAVPNLPIPSILPFPENRPNRHSGPAAFDFSTPPGRSLVNALRDIEDIEDDDLGDLPRKRVRREPKPTQLLNYTPNTRIVLRDGKAFFEDHLRTKNAFVQGNEKTLVAKAAFESARAENAGAAAACKFCFFIRVSVLNLSTIYLTFFSSESKAAQ